MTTIIKAYRYRMYPNSAEAEMIRKNVGCSRWVYNWGLAKKTKAYKENGISISRFDLQRELPVLKKQEDTKWLDEVNAQSLQASLEHLDKAYRSFFKGLGGFPKFKSKHGSKMSFHVPQYVSVDWDRSRIHLAKIGDVKIRIDRRIKGTIKSATVTVTPSGKYFVSVLADTKIEEPKLSPIASETAVGIDLGISHFAVLSSGEKVESPKPLRKYSKRLKMLQKKASKKVKRSNNRRKANKKVAIQHERIANIRNDFLHKLSSRIIRENQTVCLETLNVQGMMRNHKLSRAISDEGWTRFVSMLEYKAKWNGRNVLRIGRFDPSSKMCSGCGHVQDDLKLSDRSWTCPKCGIIHDRDVNVAINIMDFALMNTKEMNETNETKTIGGELPESKPVESRTYTSRKNGSKFSSVKRETQTSLVSG